MQKEMAVATPSGKPASEKWPLPREGKTSVDSARETVLTGQAVQWIKTVQCCADSVTAKLKQTSGGGLHEMRKGSVRAAIANEGYLSDAEV